MRRTRIDGYKPLALLALFWVVVPAAVDTSAEPPPPSAAGGSSSESAEAGPAVDASPPTNASAPANQDLNTGQDVSLGGDASRRDDVSSSEYVRFSFRETPWPEVLRMFAEWAGLTLDLTDVPSGSFSYYDNRRHTPAEAIDVLNGYLLPRGYVLLHRDQFLAVLKTENPMLSNLVPTVELEELNQRGENELLRIVVPLNDVSPTQAAEEVKDMLGPHGSVTALETSQSVLVQGFGRVLRDVVALLGDAKPAITTEKLDFRAFTLKHLPAADAEKQITNLFGLSTGTMNVSGARSDVDRAIYYRNRSRQRGKDDEKDKQSPPIPLLTRVAMNMKVSSLPRTNSLLVTATPAGLALVAEVLESIDVPQGSGMGSLLDNGQPTLRVYKLNGADESEVAKTLDVVIPGVVVNEDRRQDAIHVMATPAEHAEVAKVIRTLDDDGSDDRSVEVIRLKRFDAYAMSDLLSGLFQNEDRDERPVIRAEPHTSTIVVRGTLTQVEQVREALKAYGEGAEDIRDPQQPRFRRIVIGKASAESVARAVEEVLSGDGEFKNPIRVVVPGRPADAAPDASTNAPTDGARLQNRWTSDGDVQTLFTSDRMPSDDSTGRRAGAAPATREQESTDRGPRQSRVTIRVQGDQLLLYSADGEALGEVEETIRDLVRELPDRTQWTIFYLRAADAQTASSRLYDLLPSEVLYPSLGSSIDALGPTAQPLRIVPEPRTNALFVSGPDSHIAEVERLLEYLDTTDVPKSFRERIPRTIPVRYMDVNQMAEIVRSLYGEYLANSAEDRERGDGNDREREEREDDRGEDDRDRSRRRGSQGRNGNRRSIEARLALAVDERARELIVACDRPLFDEIEALVQQRDLAARRVPTTFHMVPLQSHSVAAALDALQAMPNVTVTTVPATQQNTRDNRARPQWRDRNRRAR